MQDGDEEGVVLYIEDDGTGATVPRIRPVNISRLLCTLRLKKKKERLLSRMSVG